MNGASWGGSEELWFQSAIATARKGIKTGVCCFDWPEKQAKLAQLKEAGCELFLLPGKSSTRSQLLPNIKLKKLLASIPFEEYELVIVNQGGWKEIVHGPFKSLHERLKDYIILYHNYNVNEKLNPLKKDNLQAWVFKARKNMGATLKIFHAMRDVYKIAIDKTEKLFNPLTITAPNEPIPFPGLINGKYQFSVLAALDIERKAQDVLIRSLSHSEWKDRNWELHLYGEGKDRSLLQRLVKSLNLEKRILLHGNATNYMEAIVKSHLVLQITNIDAMPLSVMEAMAVAKPLVISNVGDMPHWVKENENGWIVREVEVEMVRKTLDRAWENRENWEAMGKKSFERFQKDFPADPVEHFLKQIGFFTT